MAKQRVYLTDITLHTRDFRPTVRFSKAAEKGRMYSPLPKDYAKNTESKNGTFDISINLPQDLLDGMERGEIEIMVPKDGLLIYAGKDVYDLIEKMNHAKHRQLIHRTWGEKAWRDKQKGV